MIKNDLINNLFHYDDNVMIIYYFMHYINENIDQQCYFLFIKVEGDDFYLVEEVNLMYFRIHNLYYVYEFNFFYLD